MSESTNEGIRLPGIELSYPTTWQGTIAVVAVCAMVTIVFYTFIKKVDSNTASDVAQTALNLFNPSAAQLVAKDIDEEQLVAKLTSETTKFKAALDEGLTEVEKTKIKDEVAALSVATIETKERPPETYTLDESFAIMANNPAHKEVVKFALSNKSIFGNAYWYSPARLAEAVKRENPGKFTSYDLRKSINQLADVGVLSLQPGVDGKSIKYGTTPDSEALVIFMEKAGL